MTNYQNIVFGVDLVKAAQDEYDFLLKVDGLEYLRKDAVLQYAIHRYDNLWLPLVASQNDEHILSECLEPPVDIAWVWHCHMLSPHNYAAYCQSRFKKVLNHSISKSRAAHDLTRMIWSCHYPKEPFGLNKDIMDGNMLDSPLHHHQSITGEISSFDLLAAIHRQRNFVYNIHLPHYRDAKFLNDALTRYKKYLFLKEKNPTKFLVPCYDIDLIWHTHQLHPIDYERVTKSLLGRLLIHDDTDSDRNPGSKLCNAYEQTRKLWQEEYGESIAKPGAMYRGDSPRGELYILSNFQIEKLSDREADVVIKSISISPLNTISCKNVNLKIYTKEFTKELPLPKNMTRNNLNIQFLFGPPNAWLNFELRRKTFFRRECKEVGKLKVKFGNYLKNLQRQNGGDIKLKEDMKMTNRKPAVTCTVSASIGRPSLAGIVLVLESGTYEEVNMPTNNDQLWGFVPVVKSDKQNVGQVATHRLPDLNGNVVFTCRIIHNVPLMTSVVHVFFYGNVAAVAYVIGTDQLPIDTQTSGNISLNPSAGERAILIKTGHGDSMILVGKWTEFVWGRKEIPGNPGHLELKVYQMNPIGVPTEEKIHLSLNHPLVYEGLTVDFQNGTITCTKTKTHKIVEYVTFSFSVALLYNLCVPRSEWTPEKHARKDNVEAIPGENMSFMRAAGLLLFYTPSNFFMYRTFPVLFCTRCADERPLSDSCGNESDQRQRVINSDKGDFRDCCGGDIGDVNDKETLIHVHSLKIKDIAKANGFSPESLFQLKEAGLLYSTPYHVNIYYNYGANVYARCTARHSVPEACGIELDQSRCVINSNNGELGGEKGSHKGNGDGTDKGVGDNKNVRSADGNNGNVGVVGVVCGNDRFRDGGRGGHYGDVDYGCGERGGFGGGCGAGGCRGGGACGGGCGGGGCGGGGGGGGCGGCGCD